MAWFDEFSPPFVNDDLASYGADTGSVAPEPTAPPAPAQHVHDPWLQMAVERGQIQTEARNATQAALEEASLDELRQAGTQGVMDAMPKPEGNGSFWRGVTGVLGSLLDQNPITHPLMNAFRHGEYQARAGIPVPDRGPDAWDAFIGFGQSPSLGYEGGTTKMPAGRKPIAGGSMGGHGGGTAPQRLLQMQQLNTGRGADQRRLQQFIETDPLLRYRRMG